MAKASKNIKWVLLVEIILARFMDSQPLKLQSNFHRAPQIASLAIHSQEELSSFSLAIVISETADKLIISVQFEQHYHYTRHTEIKTNCSL